MKHWKQRFLTEFQTTISCHMKKKITYVIVGQRRWLVC